MRFIFKVVKTSNLLFVRLGQSCKTASSLVLWIAQSRVPHTQGVIIKTGIRTQFTHVSQLRPSKFAFGGVNTLEGELEPVKTFVKEVFSK